MKTEIPEQLKKDVPQTLWGKVLLATPVVMTIVATLLAALAQSEMSKAQYDRSLGAQLQSKAGDQWAFFQAKRLRSAVQLGTLDVVTTTGADHPIDAAGLRALAATLSDSDPVQRALDFLLAGRLPPMAPAATPAAPVQAALDAVAQGCPETELARLLRAAPRRRWRPRCAPPKTTPRRSTAPWNRSSPPATASATYSNRPPPGTAP